MLILCLPPPYTNLNSQANRHCEREKSHGGERRRRKEIEKAQKKPLRRDQDLNPQTQSPLPSVLSIRPQCPAFNDILNLLLSNLYTPFYAYLAYYANTIKKPLTYHVAEAIEHFSISRYGCVLIRVELHQDGH